MITALQVITNRDEYSRFESGRSVVKARVIPTPATAPDETVTLNLCRKSGHVLATRTVTFGTGEYPKGTVVEFDLPAIADAAGIPTVVSGDYYLEAETATVTSPRQSFTVSLITVDEMRRSYCKGLPMKAGEVLAAKRQPRAVTGITITGVSDNSFPGLYPLIFNQTDGTLQWGGGLAVELDPSVTDEILPAEDGSYIEVTIDHFDLPAADASETIIIDQEEIPDETIRGEIRKAAKEIEHRYIRSFLEPMRIATDPYFASPAANEYFDAKAQSAAFYRGEIFNWQAKTWHISLPYQYVHQVSEITGWFGDAQSLSITSGVPKLNVKQGTIDILPKNSEYSYIISFFAQLDMWGIREYIADFWRYKAVSGLLTIEADVLKAIGYEAAIPLLTIAGQAYRGGRASESISKDGVSRSASYGNGSVYGASITEYKDWLDKNRQSIGSRYRGMMTVTL